MINLKENSLQKMKNIQKNRFLFFMIAFFLFFSFVSCAGKEQKKEMQKKVKTEEGNQVRYKAIKQDFKEIGNVRQIEYICENDGRLFMTVNRVKKKQKKEQTVLLSCNYDGSDSKVFKLPISSNETLECFSTDGKG